MVTTVVMSNLAVHYDFIGLKYIVWRQQPAIKFHFIIKSKKDFREYEPILKKYNTDLNVILLAGRDIKSKSPEYHIAGIVWGPTYFLRDFKMIMIENKHPMANDIKLGE